jgi:putative transposase
MTGNSGRILHAWRNQWHQSASNPVSDSRRANAICERFLGSVRRECLDHYLIFLAKQLHRLLKAYALYFNQARPHQGLEQRIPDPPVQAAPPLNQLNQVIAVPVLGGLHHDYRKAA